MRCPKCRYISFDAGERCRNCGYEFSLTVDVEALDLPIQTGDEPEGPLDDFSLGDGGTPPAPAPARAPAQPPSQVRAGFDLPLFGGRGGDDDAPLVTPPAVPRAPLAVRKASPAGARVASRARVEEPELDLGPAEDPARAERSAHAASPHVEEPTGEYLPAPLGRRIGAAIVDLLILGAIDGAVLYFTMRLCGLQLFELGMIPKAPFLAFLVMQNGGYFVGFVAAGGQTIGKMAFGIRVVRGADAPGWPDRVPFGTAVARAAAWLIAVVPAGVGLLPALFSADGRALHDRLANTRVVRA